MNWLKGQKYMTSKNESPRSEVIQYATAKEQRRITNSPRMNEAAGPKQIQPSVVDVSSDENKFWCCKEEYCIGTWNVQSMNQGKLEMVKQEMVRININILGISKLKCIGMGAFSSDYQCIYYCLQESYRSNKVIIINKRVWNTVLGCMTDDMILYIKKKKRKL